MKNGCSDYHLGQFRKLTVAHLKMMCVASLAARVPEALIRAFLADDRLLRRIDHYQQVEAEALASLSGIGVYTFRRLAQISQGSFTETSLAHAVQQTARIALAYLSRELWFPLEQAPRE